MADSIVGSVVEFLASNDESLRDIALDWLCEAYLDDPSIARVVFDQWDERTPQVAFSHFPMLGYFPVPPSLIEEACQRSWEMTQQGLELTSPTTRSAGKLLEQVVKLPTNVLAPHRDQIARLTESHKIFFRVDIASLDNRIALLEKSAEEISELLDQSVEMLARDPENSSALRQGEQALEALRFRYPQLLDLSAFLKSVESASPYDRISLQLILLSLSQFSDSQPMESFLAPHLHSGNQSILSLVLEALVRCGSGDAARVLFEQFPSASESNRRWIARGLQRMRVHNLAPLIAQLRNRVSDNSLWNMLLVAEMQQLDPQSGPGILQALSEVESVNQAIIDAGLLYTFVCSPLQEHLQPVELEEGFRAFLLRVQSGLSSEESSQGTSAEASRVQDKKLLRIQRHRMMEQHFKKKHRSE